MTKRTPSPSYSLSFSPFLSNPSTYERPEQPPPFTPMRRWLSASNPGSLIRRFNSATAPSVNFTGESSIVSILQIYGQTVLPPLRQYTLHALSHYFCASTNAMEVSTLSLLIAALALATGIIAFLRTHKEKEPVPQHRFDARPLQLQAF